MSPKCVGMIKNERQKIKNESEKLPNVITYFVMIGIDYVAHVWIQY